MGIKAGQSRSDWPSAWKKPGITGHRPSSLAQGPSFAIDRRALTILELTALIALMLLALQYRVANLEHYSGSFDEGVRMEQLLLMEHGYRPYRDIFASQGPLLLDLLYPLYLFFGASLGATRLGVSLLSLVGLIGVWWSGRALSPPIGVAAMGLLAFSPGYLESSRLALAEVPSLAPCLWALGCALRWQRGGSAGWLYAAACLATLGVLIKPMALAVAAPLALAALVRPTFRLGPVLVSLVLGLLLAALVVLALGADRVFEVLGGYRLGVQRVAGSLANENWALIAKTLGGSEHAGFLCLAGIGAGLGLLRWRRASLTLAAWFLAQLLVFLLYTDLADKHIVYLVPPLALLGGVGVAGVVLAARRAVDLHSPVWAGAALVGLLGIALYGVGVPSLMRADRELLRDADERARRDYEGTQEQAALMAALARPTDFVLTDNPNAAFQARRLVPPWLVDTSGTRIDAGSLHSEIAIREAERYQPKVVVTWRRRLGKLEGFTQWLAANYRLIKTYPGSDPSTPLQLYVRAELEEPARSFLAGR